MKSNSSQMEADQAKDDSKGFQWVVNRIREYVDIDEAASACGAFSRKRKISSPELLLRMIFMYVIWGSSLQQVACWAAQTGIVCISDEGLRRRFHKARDFMSYIACSIFAARKGLLLLGKIIKNYCLVDATTIIARGSKVVTFRIHARYDLARKMIVDAVVTSRRGGEKLARYFLCPGDVVICDRGYANLNGVLHVIACGAEFIIRLSTTTMPLLNPDGSKFNIIAALRSIAPTVCDSGQPSDGGPASQPVPVSFDVMTKKIGKDSQQYNLRVIAVRKTDEQAEADRKRLANTYKRKYSSTKVQPNTLEAAGYFFVVTSLKKEDMSDRDVAELYRFRWQIEIAFKRLKGLYGLGELRTRNDGLGQMVIFAKLVLNALVENRVDDVTTKAQSSLDVPESQCVEQTNNARTAHTTSTSVCATIGQKSKACLRESCVCVTENACTNSDGYDATHTLDTDISAGNNTPRMPRRKPSFSLWLLHKTALLTLHAMIVSDIGFAPLNNFFEMLVIAQDKPRTRQRQSTNAATIARLMG